MTDTERLSWLERNVVFLHASSGDVGTEYQINGLHLDPPSERWYQSPRDAIDEEAGLQMQAAKAGASEQP